jgi:hypothetical protein
MAWQDCRTNNVPADRRSFPPTVALHLVKMACERPDDYGRSLAKWDCRELARQVVADGVVATISPDTVGRILNHHQLKPWRHHLWLSPKVPRDAAFAAQVQVICDLYTRPLAAHEMVLRRPACSRAPAKRRRGPRSRGSRCGWSTSTSGRGR